MLIMVRYSLKLGWKVEVVKQEEQVKYHVGYVPSGQRVVGLSKLAHVADIFAKRLQAPQRLVGEIANDCICCELNFPFWSQCEHHLLPFQGVVHIGYYSPDGRNAVGTTVLQSVVHFYGFKLQVQERFTRQITETTLSLLGEDIMVVVEASHTCMISRGIEKFGSSTTTIAVLGRFSTDPAARAKFLQNLPNFCST